MSRPAHCQIYSLRHLFDDQGPLDMIYLYYLLSLPKFAFFGLLVVLPFGATAQWKTTVGDGPMLEPWSLASDVPGLPLQCQHTPICSRLQFGAQRPCAPDFQSCDSNSVQLCDDWQEAMPNGQFHPWAPIPSSGYSLS